MPKWRPGSGWSRCSARARSLSAALAGAGTGEPAEEPDEEVAVGTITGYRGSPALPRSEVVPILERIRSGVSSFCAPCKVEDLQRVRLPPGNWVAPASSYRGGGGGNETVGAFEINASFQRCGAQAGRNLSER